MRHFLFPLIILIAFFMAGCNPQSSNNAPEEQPAEPENSQVDNQEAEGELPDGWVEGIPLYPDFEVQDFQGDGDTMRALCSGYKPIPKVAEFYDEVEGWERDRSRVVNPRLEYQTLYFTKGDREMMILVGRNETNTVLDIEVYYPDRLENNADPE
jgi:hypothetical protein